MLKKYDSNLYFQFQLGSTILKESDSANEDISTLFNHCISTTKDLQEQIQTYEKDTERLSQERINALKVTLYEHCAINYLIQ